MKHRKYPSRPPTSSNYKSGLVLNVAPSADDPDPSKMVEVITTASAPLILNVASSPNDPDPSKMVEVISAGSVPSVPEVAPDNKQTQSRAMNSSLLADEHDLIAPTGGLPAPKPRTSGNVASELAALLAVSENPRQAMLRILRQVLAELKATESPARDFVDQIARAVDGDLRLTPEPSKE